MAKNYVSGDSRTINLTVGASVDAGTPVKVVDITGTTITESTATDTTAVVDVAPTATYKHSVRNVTAYSGGVENTYAAASEGKTVYFDASSTMPTGVKLSLSPLDKDGSANVKFGKIVGGADSTATAKTALNVEIIQDRA